MLQRSDSATGPAFDRAACASFPTGVKALTAALVVFLPALSHSVSDSLNTRSAVEPTTTIVGSNLLTRAHQKRGPPVFIG